MKTILALVGLLLVVLMQLAIYYVLVPFILMHVLLLFGVKISFWLCVGICFLFYIMVKLLKAGA